MPRLLWLLLLLASFKAQAVVVRDDVDDALYRVPQSAFPALADMPGEGHGVLIAPQWVLTVAHAVPWGPDDTVREVVIAGKPRRVQDCIIHPGYRPPQQALTDHALATWDWTLFMVGLSSSDDIALLKLAAPVTDVAPIPIYRGHDEFGQVVSLFGKGATGTGKNGYEADAPHRTVLRRAQNKVTSAHGRWFCYVFDGAPEALPLEGGSGSGDSGGPIVAQTGIARAGTIKARNGWSLLGLTSWTAPQGAARTSFGRYGQISCNVRVSHYQAWIDGLVSPGRSPAA